MQGKIFLSGGGDEKKSFFIDELFTHSVKNILYIPLAWTSDNEYKNCLKWFKKCMAQHKFSNITMLTDLNKKIDLNKFSAIYIGGGNFFKLLKLFRSSGFDKKLISFNKNGGIVYGGSAGAIILGKNISTSRLCKFPDNNEVNLKDLNGLDLIFNNDLQCHFEENQLNEHINYVKKIKEIL